PQGSGSIAAHWDGNLWTSTTLPNVFASYIWGLASDDIWLAGYPAFFHWNGSTWSNVPGKGATSIWGAASNDIWSVDGTFGAHWDGTAWSDRMFTTAPMAAITGFAANDIWGVGSGSVYHWNGTTWSLAFTSPDGANLDGIWGSGP